MNLRNLLNWFLSPSFDNYNMSHYDITNVASLMCNECARQGTRKVNTGLDYRRIHVRNIEIRRYKEDTYLNPILSVRNLLNSECPRHIRHFLLHGSMADLKFVKGWSDLDSWVVIDDDVFNNPLSLIELRVLFNKLNKFLLEIDPIAHHGFIILLKSDLDDYGDFLLPAEVINTARNLYGPTEILVSKSNVNSDWSKKFLEIKNTFVEFDKCGVFRHHPYNGKYLTKDMINHNDGMYQFKYLIGSVLLIPSMYLSAIGKSVYKPESFEPFLKIFPDSSIIRCVSGIRQDWEKNECHPYIPNKIPGWLIERLPSDYVLQIIRLLDDIADNICKV